VSAILYSKAEHLCFGHRKTVLINLGQKEFWVEQTRKISGTPVKSLNSPQQGACALLVRAAPATAPPGLPLKIRCNEKVSLA
jgi:hypothetical protein